MLEFIQACKAFPKGRFGKLPSSGMANFTLITPVIEVYAGAVVKDKKLTNLTLTNRDDFVSVIGQTRIDFKKPAREATWRVGQREENVLESWFNTGDTLEAIYRSQLFLRELEILVYALEAGIKTKRLGI